MLEQARRSQVLHAARESREELLRALVALERAIAAPAAGRTAEWLTVVFGALLRLRQAFDQHVVETEGPDALFDEILAAQPRLSHSVKTLADEHAQIRETVDELLGVVHELSQDGPRAEEVREAILALILALARHRQRGADLVYEAYAVDIGGGD